MQVLKTSYRGAGKYHVLAEALNKIGRVVNNIHGLPPIDVTSAGEEIRIGLSHDGTGGNHPFRVTRKDKHTLQVGQGYVFAGVLAEYDWPQPADVKTVDVAAWPAGKYNLIMEVTVDDDYGYFTAYNKPILNQDPGECLQSAHHALQVLGQCDVVLAQFEVKVDAETGERTITGLREDQHNHIYVPVYYYQTTYWDTPTASYLAYGYMASWGVPLATNAYPPEYPLPPAPSEVCHT